MARSTDSPSDNEFPIDPPSRNNSESGPGNAQDAALNADARQSLDPAVSSKLKRTACVLCRKRKLRCDAARPACATCARLGHECEYDEQRKKSGPKRGYVKALENRLAQVEKLLRTQDGQQSKAGQHTAFGKDLGPSIADLSTIGMADPADLSNIDHPDVMEVNRAQNMSGSAARQAMGTMEGCPTDGSHSKGPFLQDMISLGLEEPLPTPEITDTLNRLYFLKVNVSLPMIHKARFYAAMNLAPSMRPPVCLRYAMWAQAASTTDDFEEFQSHFYQRARKYLELDEMRGFGQSILTVSHCQAWLLVAMYEFKNMFFPRAWMSTGRAIRLTQMLALHRLDGQGLDVKMAVAPPRDWTEREERRRTFWLVYWADRCASIGTGWPMSFEEKDILTNLPAPDEAFQNSQPARTSTLAEALQSLDRDISSTSGCVLMATLFGRNLTHLHRPEVDDNEQDLNGKFWQRHRAIDAILLNVKLNLPDHLRIPLGIHDPNVVFLNMCLHASAICLHQAAIFKAERHRLPTNIAGESKMRCIAAASEIATIMRTVSHMDLVQMNPFTAFCLYVAARVFVQFLRARPSEQQVSASLHFLLSAMHAMTRKNPLTESFIAQLELDMETAGIANPLNNNAGMDAMHQRGVPEYKDIRQQSHSETMGVMPQGTRMIAGADSGADMDPELVQGLPVGGAGNSEVNARASQRMVFANYSHTSGILPYGSNARPGDPMETSQADTSSGPGYHSRTVMTPPADQDGNYNDDGSSNQHHQGSIPSIQMPSTNTSYGFSGQYASNGDSYQSSRQQTQQRGQQMNVEDFSQFMPLSASGYSLPAGWETMSFPGLTPGAEGSDAEDFAKMLNNVESWPGGEPLMQDSWSNMPG